MLYVVENMKIFHLKFLSYAFQGYPVQLQV